MKVRVLDIDFSAARAHWARNAEFAQLQNAGGLTPAHVEPYLVKVMIEARKHLGPEHAQLKDDIGIFIRQETQHYKQHQRFNQALYEAGYDGLPGFDRELGDDYVRFLAEKSLKFNCAYCEGFETLGPPNAYAYFSGFGGLLEGADKQAVDLWKWHMAEEFEHRDVCHRVYNALYGKTFFNRYVYRVYGVIVVLRHLGGWVKRVGHHLLAKDREGMSAEELNASRRREGEARGQQTRQLLPRLLLAFLPTYDPGRHEAPAGMEAYLSELERVYAAKPAQPMA